MPIHSTIICMVKMLSKRGSLSSSVFCFVSGQAAMAVGPETQQWETGLSWSVGCYGKQVLALISGAQQATPHGAVSDWHFLCPLCYQLKALCIERFVSAAQPFSQARPLSQPVCNQAQVCVLASPGQFVIRPKAVYWHHWSQSVIRTKAVYWHH